MSKKRTGGEGWTLVSAGAADPSGEVISLPPQEQRVRISLEKRRKGKVVTLVDNLVLSEPDLRDLGKSLKVMCGTGGTVRDRRIELQGDRRSRVRAWLLENGWGVR